MSRIHPNLLSEGFLRDALVLQLGQQRLQGHALQVRLHVGEIADVLALFGYDDLKQAGILDERDSQGFAMMTVAVFANVTTAGGRETLGIELDRDRVGAMVPNHFGGDFRATPDRCGKGIDVRFGFLTGDA